MESGERLKGWIKAYGITRETEEVQGAESHIERIRKPNGKKVEVQMGEYKFTFKKVPGKVEEQGSKDNGKLVQKGK